jgi:hypothetical protein
VIALAAKHNTLSGLLGVAGIIWLGCWLYLGRYYQLDDAFIHLRYAHNLRDYGFLTFDGAHPSAGCSSLLYVAVLSILAGLITSIHATKALSLTGYLSLLALILWVRRDTQQSARSLWGILLIVLVSPMASRWLCDGMETGLVVLFSLLLATLAYSTSLKATSSALRYLAFLSLGWAIVTLRVDSSVLVATGSVGAWILSVERTVGAGGSRPRFQNLFRLPVREGHLAIGGLLGVATIYFMTRHVLPDSAVAKASGHFMIGQLWGIARAFLASMSLGLGLMVIWVLTLVLLVGDASLRRRHHSSLLVINCSLLIPVAATVVRGQAVHGVRYFLAPLIFMIAWNLLMLSGGAIPPKAIHDCLSPVKTRRRALLISSLTMLALAWLVEGAVVGRIFRDQSRSILAMRSQHLEALANRTGVAFDVGLISYFSNGHICDLSGLVNGRTMAHETIERRADYCARQSPAFAYLTTSQASFFGGFVNLDSWRLCHEYWQPSAGGGEPHYLLVTRDVAGACRQPGALALPVSAVR